MSTSICIDHEVLKQQSPVLLYRELSDEVSDFLCDATSKEVELLPFGLRNILRLARLEGEILNGGLYQYFSNLWDREDDRKEVYAMADGLAAVGASEMENVVRKAIMKWEEFAERYLSLCKGCPRSQLSDTLRMQCETLVNEMESVLEAYDDEILEIWGELSQAIYEHIKLHEDQYLFAYPPGS